MTKLDLLIANTKDAKREALVELKASRERIGKLGLRAATASDADKERLWDEAMELERSAEAKFTNSGTA